MLAVLYLFLTIIFGVSFAYAFIDTQMIYKKISGAENYNLPKSLFTIPAGIIIGISCITFFNYYSILLLDLIKRNNQVNYPIGITLTFIIFSIFSFINIKKVLSKKDNQSDIKKSLSKKSKIYFSVVLILCFAISTFFIFDSVHYEEDDILLGTASSFDISAHIGMTTTFGEGGNVPTQYVFFANDGIHWHFFFYFFSRILNYLGLPLVFALNIPSIMSMMTMLILGGTLACLISKHKSAFLITTLLILFRSSFEFLPTLSQLIKDRIPILSGIIHLEEWLDSWGMYSLNIYALQRHLLFGISALLIIVTIFLPYLFDMIKELKNLPTLKEKIKKLFFSKYAWLPDFKDKNIFTVILLVIAMPYFHGSALIACLLILFCFAIFSRNRLNYLVVAILSIIASLIQTNILSGGASSILRPGIVVGYILSDPSFFEMLSYFITVSGLTAIISLIYAIIHRKQNIGLLVIYISALLPTIVAFTIQITVETQANHKFLQITFIILDILVAAFMSNFLAKKELKIPIRISYKDQENGTILKNIEVLYKNTPLKVIVFSILSVFLLSTGVFEFFIIHNRNKSTISLNPTSDFVTWIKENSSSDDVFLTPPWYINNFYLTGRCTYNGWAYYAWSAGHDTTERGQYYNLLLSGMDENKDAYVESCKNNHIKYIIDCPEMFDTQDSYEQPYYNQNFIRSNFELVAIFKDIDTRIYKVYD